MPTIDMNKKDLEALIGKRLPQQDLESSLMFVKGEIDAVNGNNIKLDVKETNRPDLWSAEGIARELRARLGMEKGIPRYKIWPPKLQVKIEPSVKSVRPLTVCAVIKDLQVTEELLVQMIQLQEKIHATFGRKRKEAAMGVYDFDKIRGNIRYYGAKPSEKKFVPLEYKVEMELDEILEMHPKGKEFAHLIKGKDRYPIFEDSKGNVLSMPPIINSDYSGKVTDQTKNLFIEVSGFNRETIMAALNVMVMALADRGGKIEGVTVIDADNRKSTTPEFRENRIAISEDYIKKISGLDLKEKEINALLEKARYEVKSRGKGGKLVLAYGNYRNDILHPVDVVEDILIGYGYNNIAPLQPQMCVIGEERPETSKLDECRSACTGLGMQEVLTFVLTSKEKQVKMVGLADENFIEIANPVSANWGIMRKNLFPELLEFLAKNKSAEYPQRIFEVGKVVKLDAGTDTKTRESTRLCIAMAGSGNGFTLAKSVLQSICRELRIEFKLKEMPHPVLKEGRCAEIAGGTSGIIGEVSEETKKNFGIEQDISML